MNIEVASRLYDLRRKKGLSQEELADALGVTRQAVSKWERAESSPDTDNLIALARLYEVSLDELVGLKGKQEPIAKEGAKSNSDFRISEDDGINVTDVHINQGSKKVKIDNSGIYISDGERETEISSSGVFAERKDKAKKTLFFSSMGGMIAAIIYILLGGLGGWWHPGWLVFLLIPIFSGLEAAIRNKNPLAFPYPVFCVLIFLTLGVVWKLWHPYWVIFLTIPIYYWLVNTIKQNKAK